MIVSNLDDLKKLFELCREQKVESVCIDGISAKFTPAAFNPPKPPDLDAKGRVAEQDAEEDED